MKRFFLLLLAVFVLFSTATMAQSKKEKKKAEETAQLLRMRDSYKRMLQDSLGINAVLADTTAAISLDYMQKSRDILSNKKMSQDDKDMQTGMLAEMRENKLKILLPQEAYDHLMAMERRQKQEYEKREKERKDAQNQQPMMNNNYNYGRGGYGRYY